MGTDYYTAKDIMSVTGVKQTLAYDILKKLQNKFLKEYPETIIIQGKIPKWYFEEKMHNKKANSNETKS